MPDRPWHLPVTDFPPAPPPPKAPGPPTAPAREPLLPLLAETAVLLARIALLLVKLAFSLALLAALGVYCLALVAFFPFSLLTVPFVVAFGVAASGLWQVSRPGKARSVNVKAFQPYLLTSTARPV